jgi:uncharacterized membrane protein
MGETDQKIEELQARLGNLLKQQEQFQREISQMREEIGQLRLSRLATPVRDEVPPPPAEPVIFREKPKASPFQPIKPRPSSQDVPPGAQAGPNFQTATAAAAEKSDLEKFIGENLASKIGILITVIGVVIGAKYAIDNELVSPLMRIVFGYLVGFGLLGFGIKLKARYHNFSAVLVSGAMAIMYFVTFAAYTYYGLFSQASAFVLMLIITVSTVAAAVSYNRQIIAHVGMVGAYSIPFLLSENTGRVDVLFTYIAIINIGILVVSLKKYWRSIHYLAFGVTWVIYLSWHLTRYTADQFNFALGFATLYFLTFYLTFTLYKIITEAELSFDNVFLILANSFVYFGVGHAVIDDTYEGAFAIANAGIHFLFAFALDRFKPFERNAIYFFAALMLTFCTIAVPIQLEGRWITLLWITEAVILFTIGRVKRVQLYEHFSYPLMLLAFFSLLKDWLQMYFDYDWRNLALTPIFNPYFLTGMIFVAAFAVIWQLNKNAKYPINVKPNLYPIFSFVIAAILLFALYNTFRIEISNYFHAQSLQTAIRETEDRYRDLTNPDLPFYNFIWQLNYTMLFLTLLSFANITSLRDKALGFVTIAVNLLTMFVFLTAGLLVLTELRDNFLYPPLDGRFAHSSFNIVVRYICYAFFIALLYANYRLLKEKFIGGDLSEASLTMISNLGIHLSAIWILSSELLNWTDIYRYAESYKLGLSLLWGSYALFLVGLGINRHRKHLRVGAIVLFAITLIKLFFYDIAELGTISKTIVFVSLGVLLLIISFLYNKYKHLIFEEAGQAAANE